MAKFIAVYSRSKLMQNLLPVGIILTLLAVWIGIVSCVDSGMNSNKTPETFDDALSSGNEYQSDSRSAANTKTGDAASDVVTIYHLL